MARIQDYNVMPGDQVMLEGTLSYSRIANKIDGEALRQENERRAANGMIQANAPFWSIALDDPIVIYKSGDPNQPTPLESFWANEKIYSKRSGGTGTSAEKKGNIPPNVFQLKGSNAIPLHLAGELASGSRVRVIIETYRAKMGMGYGFSSVLVMDDPVHYFEGNSIARALIGYGIAVSNEEANVVSVSELETEETPAAPAAPAAPEPQAAPAPQPPQFAQPQPQPQAGPNPFQQNGVSSNNPFNR